MSDLDFPLIYVNGCSYSDENYHPLMKGNTYAHYIGRLLNGFVLSRAKSGSCNRRIIRTTLHDIIKQQQLNPTQRIIALIQLSFELRNELWNDQAGRSHDACESNFEPHQFSKLIDWRERLLSGQRINQDSSFLNKWSEGRAYFYSPYAERINLLMDLVMLKHTLDARNIEYVIFQGPTAEKLNNEYLKDFFLSELDSPRIIDFETFGFCSWCQEHNFSPLDKTEPLNIGHYGPDAHLAFAEKFLYNKL